MWSRADKITAFREFNLNYRWRENGAWGPIVAIGVPRFFSTRVSRNFNRRIAALTPGTPAHGQLTKNYQIMTDVHNGHFLTPKSLFLMAAGLVVGWGVGSYFGAVPAVLFAAGGAGLGRMLSISYARTAERITKTATFFQGHHPVLRIGAGVLLGAGFGYSISDGNPVGAVIGATVGAVTTTLLSGPVSIAAALAVVCAVGFADHEGWLDGVKTMAPAREAIKSVDNTGGWFSKWWHRTNVYANGQSDCQLPLTKAVAEQNGDCDAMTASKAFIFKAKAANGSPDNTPGGRIQVGPDTALKVKGLYPNDPSYAEIEPTSWGGRYVKTVTLKSNYAPQ